MKVTINRKDFNFLIEALCDDESDLVLPLMRAVVDSSVVIDLDDDIADEIRDWAGETLQRIGFDEEYSLNDQGEILERLVDAFFLKD